MIERPLKEGVMYYVLRRLLRREAGMTSSQTNRPRVGELLRQLLRSLLAANPQWELDSLAVEEIAKRTGYSTSRVYDWRDGSGRLRPDTLKIILSTGKEAGLDRFWGYNLTQAAEYGGNAEGIIHDIWGPQQLREVPTNLPIAPLYTAFVGRKNEIKRLMELLSIEHPAHLITVDGIAGVGKTTLVIEVARRCLQASTGELREATIPTFDAIIFTSAKQQLLTSGGIIALHQARRTRRDICKEIARALGRPEIMLASPDEQLELARDAVGRQRTLLIVDNLETMEDQFAILDFVFNLPRQVKTIVTTRDRSVAFVPIRLENLPEAEGLELIAHEAHERSAVLDDTQAYELYERTGGIPAAVLYAIGQIADGADVKAVLERVSRATGDVARYCFASSIEPLRGSSAHFVLMAMAMFPKRPLRNAVLHVAGLLSDPIIADDALLQLQRLSLVGHREGRYYMLPLTREYALAELAAHQEFAQGAYERRLEWYLEYARKYGGQDWEEWHIKFDHIEEEWENFLEVFGWCAAEDRYDAMVAFWQRFGDRDHDEREGGVLGFSNIYGYWNDRLWWLDWLIEAAERRGDWFTVIGGLRDRGFTLILMAQPDTLAEAQQQLERAWSLRSDTRPHVRGQVAQNIGVLYLRRKLYDEALAWLDTADQEHKQAELDEPLNSRHWLPVPYYRAEVHFWRGEYDEAKALYQQVWALAQTIKYERAVNYVQNWLADIALMQEDFDEAAHLLRTGMPVAERNKDMRRTAFYRRSFARLAKARREFKEMRESANKARDGFERLGMLPEAREMQDLESLPSVASDTTGSEEDG